MSHEDEIANLRKMIGLQREALETIRKIMEVQMQRLDNLENFMMMLQGHKPNPEVGVPPSDL